MKNQTVVMLLLAALCAPAWAVNKCTGPDGKMTYQEAKCADGAKTVAIKLQAPPAGVTSLDDRIKQAADKCGVGKLPEYPEIGWPEDRFLSCSIVALSSSPKINTTETAAGVSKQYVFSYYRTYVYVRAGKVVAIQRL